MTDVAQEAATGKAYLHTDTDVMGRPVIVVRVVKHVTGAHRGRGAACPTLAQYSYSAEQEAVDGIIFLQHALTRTVRILSVAGHNTAHCCAGASPLADSQRLCVFTLEQAIARLPASGDPDTVLGVFDLKGFSHRNADLGFVRFLVRRAHQRTLAGTVTIDAHRV